MRVRIGPVDCERFNWSDTTGIDLFTNLQGRSIERDTRRVYLYSNINMGKQLLYITCVCMVGNGRKVKATGGYLAIRHALTAFLSTGDSGAHFEKLLYSTWNIIIYTLPASANCITWSGHNKKKKKPKTRSINLRFIVTVNEINNTCLKKCVLIKT